MKISNKRKEREREEREENFYKTGIQTIQF